MPGRHKRRGSHLVPACPDCLSPRQASGSEVFSLLRLHVNTALRRDGGNGASPAHTRSQCAEEGTGCLEEHLGRKDLNSWGSLRPFQTRIRHSLQQEPAYKSKISLSKLEHPISDCY